MGKKTKSQVKELSVEERRIKDLEKENKRLTLILHVTEAERDILIRELPDEIAALKKKGSDPERLKRLETVLATHLLRSAKLLA